MLLTFDLFDDVEPALTRLELLLGFELAVAGADSNILLSDESLLSNTNVARGGGTYFFEGETRKFALKVLFGAYPY